MAITDKRIYCIVASTVQTPLFEVTTHNPISNRFVTTLKTMEGTCTIVQPAGRLIAQAAHVISKVRERMLKDFFNKHSGDSKFDRAARKSKWTEDFEPITTIILSVRDSFELQHVFELLNQLDIAVQHFCDFNQPDYGDPSWEVMTAIATEPTTPEEVVGVLDYLPLWKP